MPRPGSRFHKAIHGRLWELARRQCFEVCGWRCTRCGKSGRLEAHHVLPLHRGGAPFDLGNLAALCRSCHISIHKRPVSESEQKWLDLVRDLI